MIRRVEKQEVARSIRAAFTLMEMMVVVAILVVLVGVAVPTYMSYLEKSKVKTARADVETISNCCKTFYFDQGTWPSSVQDLARPPSGKPYIKSTSLTDPWDQPYQISQGPGPNMIQVGDEAPDVWSTGPPSSPQMIGNWMKMR